MGLSSYTHGPPHHRGTSRTSFPSPPYTSRDRHNAVARLCAQGEHGLLDGGDEVLVHGAISSVARRTSSR